MKKILVIIGLVLISAFVFADDLVVDGSISGFKTMQANTCVANGENSVSLGKESNATGFISTALNWHTIASGQASFASGWDTLSAGQASTSTGQETKASGLNSFAAGYRTTAPAMYSTIFGNNATNNTPNSFGIGFNGLQFLLTQDKTIISNELNLNGKVKFSSQTFNKTMEALSLGAKNGYSCNQVCALHNLSCDSAYPIGISTATATTCSTTKGTKNCWCN